MRKSFTILTAILVCALTAVGATSRMETSVTPAAAISVVELNQRITEARQLLQESPTISRDSVRVAVLDSTNGELTTIPLSKDEFLTKDANIEATTAAGEKVRVPMIRANGVNTATTLGDAMTHEALIPLVVQFPILSHAAVSEAAQYTSFTLEFI